MKHMHTIRKITALAIASTLFVSIQPVTASSAGQVSALAKRYDMRTDAPELLTSVKSQVGGTCWAFAAMGCAESNLIQKGLADNSIDLSEAHLIWFTHGQDSPTDPADPCYGGGVNKGVAGYDGGALAYNTAATLAAWQGVVLESDAPSLAKQVPIDESQRYQSIAHLQNMEIYDPEDIHAIKYQLTKKGPMQLDYYSLSDVKLSDKSAYYNPKGMRGEDETDGGGHAVMIVGWDDTFSKENFNSPPPGDGAWICKNSWGKYSHSEDGYFYMSYYEPSLGRVTYYDFEPVTNYGSVHHYNNSDLHYDAHRLQSQKLGMEFANVFEAEQDEKVTAIGFFTGIFHIPGASTEYEAEIYALNADYKDPRDGTLVSQIDGVLEHSGYHTLKLQQNYSAKKGQKYAVIVKIPYGEISGTLFDSYCYKKGVSYYTHYSEYNEEPWKDCYDEGEGDCCIHVYTANNSGQSTEIIKNKEGTYIDLFPDPLIRANMLSEYDKDGDQYITTEELMSIMITPYDVDGDGQANSVDLTLLKRAALGLQEPDGKYHWYAGDLSVNSYIDEADARIMLSFVLQRPPKKAS